jgi:malto-oligosyltrehalose trehalohydrolase
MAQPAARSSPAPVPGSSPVRRRHAMPFGAEPGPAGTRFRLWAPLQAEVWLEIEGHGRQPMARAGDGWHELLADTGPGARYRFRLADGALVPDPASRFQPDDVHGPSEVVDPTAYRWRDAAWRGRPWHEAVLYELHVGSFTPEGTFRAVIDRLDHLQALGVTALQVMPVADFPGGRNWGYDGVLPFAPDSRYGRPEDLKALVEAAHRRGLMVLLDVVYNHFGPEGNYLPALAPLFTDRHKTPWGNAVNVDGEQSAAVRAFLIHNALYWIEEFHLDGLRLDAVHQIKDDSDRHLLAELAEQVRAAAPGRCVHLVLENEENEAARLERGEDGAPALFTAQWNDDVHHGLHVALTGESAGYYGDYQGGVGRLARALAEGFAFQGEVMHCRGTPRGQPSAHLPPTAFVAFLQNHDQIGNRAFGERITRIAPAEAVRAAAAVYLLAPQIPMLFMGEEWAAPQPFPFFCDFGPDLAAAVTKGRREEFARFPEFHDPGQRQRIPDPTAEATFDAARLDWSRLGHDPHAAWLDWYRRALAVRQADILPLLPAIGPHAGSYRVFSADAFAVRWQGGGAGDLMLAANLGPAPVAAVPAALGRVLWREGAEEGGRLEPWSVRWSVEPPL